MWQYNPLCLSISFCFCSSENISWGHLISFKFDNDRAAVITLGVTEQTDKYSALEILKSYIWDGGAKSNLIPAPNYLVKDVLKYSISNESCIGINHDGVSYGSNQSYPYNIYCNGVLTNEDVDSSGGHIHCLTLLWLIFIIVIQSYFVFNFDSWFMYFFSAAA